MPSGQYVTSSRTATTTQVIRLTARNTAAKPTNRRTVDMSLDARESS